MRYSDEGNLKFSGNIRSSSVEPTPSQGYYRDELDYGKYSITLTNSEPGLGYFGFNEDELTYDIDNHKLCTKNIYAEGDISADGNVSFDGNLSLAGNITSGGNASFDGTISSVGNISSEGDGLFEGTITACSDATVGDNLNVSNNVTVGGTIDSTGNIHTSGTISSDGCIISGSNLSVSGDISATGNITAPGGNIQGSTGIFGTLCSTNNYLCSLTLGNPGHAAIRDKCNSLVLGAYDGNLYLHGACYIDNEERYNPNCQSYIEIYNGQISIKNKNTLGGTRVHLTNDDNSKGAIILENCCNNCYMGLYLVDNKVVFYPSYASQDFMELNANSINTSCACLLLNKPVCVPDIFTIGTGSSTQCHYIHTISLNGNSTSSTDGTLNLGSAVTSATVNGITRTVNNYGSITLPDLTCSITVSGVTCTVDSTGSITLPNLARCVAINGVSGRADATGRVDLGTLTAVLKVNLKGSAIIEDSSTICPDRIYNSVVIGKNVEPMNNTVDSCFNVFAGYSVKGSGCNAVAIGCDICASEKSVAIGPGAYTYSVSGNDTCIATGAVSIGCGAGSYNESGIAIGYGAQSEGYSAIALGEAAEAGDGYSVAIGCGAQALGANGIAIGCNAIASGNGIAIGCNANQGEVSTVFHVQKVVRTANGAELNIALNNMSLYCWTWGDLVTYMQNYLEGIGMSPYSPIIGHGKLSFHCGGANPVFDKTFDYWYQNSRACIYDGQYHCDSDTGVFSTDSAFVGIWTLDLIQ